MKTIGLIGGTSWESTIEYYRLINKGVRDRLGGLHSADLVLRSVEFAEYDTLMRAGDWDGVTSRLTDNARRLEAFGAEAFIICTNTMHFVADRIEPNVTIPLIHIADAAGKGIKASGITTIGLLGTIATMKQEFYRKRLNERFGIAVVTPDDKDGKALDSIIFDELCGGIVSPESKRTLVRIMNDMVKAGAEGILLACTELPLIVGPEDISCPVLDTMALHSEAVVDYLVS